LNPIGKAVFLISRLIVIDPLPSSRLLHLDHIADTDKLDLKCLFENSFPPKPTDAFKNLEPIRLSLPTAADTSSTSAPVASQSADMLFMELIRCAKKALEDELG
jgi:hypothetical protein